MKSWFPEISFFSLSLSTTSLASSLISFCGEVLEAVTIHPCLNLDPLRNPLVLCRYVRPGGGFVPNFQLFEKGDVNGEKEQKVFTFLKVSEQILARIGEKDRDAPKAWRSSLGLSLDSLERNAQISSRTKAISVVSL